MSLICALAQHSQLVEALPATTSWLNEGEARRLARFGSEPRRQHFLTGRWLARMTLSRSMADERPLDIDAEGRSHVRGQPPLFLSISHSGDWVACAVASDPIGVDIEDLSRRRDFAALAQTVHSPAQCAALAAAPEAEHAAMFYAWWTLKEAWFKRQGLGLDLGRMRTLEYSDTSAEEMDAACFVDAQRGLVLSLDSPALAGLSVLDLGAAQWLPTRRLKSPAPAPAV